MKTPEEELVVGPSSNVFCAQLLHPVVLLSDIETLLNHKAVTYQDGWRMEFKKSGPQDREPWGLNFWLDSDLRIQKFELPKRLSEVMGNEFIMRAIEAIGRAEVSIGKRRVYMNLNAQVTRAQALELMGEPLEQNKNSLLYHFGEGDDCFVVTIKGEVLLSAVIMEANGYGLEVEVLDPNRIDIDNEGLEP